MHFFKNCLKRGSAQLKLVSMSPVACSPLCFQRKNNWTWK